MTTGGAVNAGAVNGGPVMPVSRQLLAVQPISPGTVELTTGFWGDRQRQNREVTIPHGIRMLEASGTIENLRIAAGRSTAEYSLPVFRDSDLYKVLEAIAWERAHGADPDQEQFFAASVELLSAAQAPDGYINSYVQVVEKGRRFGDPAMGHELYCAGHLFQAAVADARTADGPPGLVPVAQRFASLLVDVLRSSQATLVEGHPEVETALVELYRTGGDRRLLDLAQDMIGRRGRKTLGWRGFGPSYFQDDVPFEEARSVRGHAVRCLYLLAGATDLYTESGKKELWSSALSQWEDMTTAKTYLTGGVGSRHQDEAFGDRFELPPDRAYCERCAAIASIMWNWRMLLLTGEARFAELIERTLYNGFLAGIGLDGTTSFYVNPLQARQPMIRSPWNYCACCPPNGMRLVASLEHYLVTTTDKGVQLHQYASGLVRAELGALGTLELAMETDYPFGGTVSVRAAAVPSGPCEVAVRVPSWADGISASLNGRTVADQPGPGGYLRCRREWTVGDELVIELPMKARLVRASEAIDSVRGCVAYERGPLVYCLEGRDIATRNSLEGVSVVSNRAPAEVPAFDIGGQPMVALKLEGQARSGPPGWPYTGVPYADVPDTGVPNTGGPDSGSVASQSRSGGGPQSERHEVVSANRVELLAVPYFAWANRGGTDMRVWVPEHS